MKKICMLFFVLFCSAVFSGCSHSCPVSNVIEIRPNGVSVSSGSADPALQSAVRQCERLLYAVQHQDGKIFAELFDPQFVRELDESGFEESCRKVKEDFGQITGYTYLCSLKLPMMQNLVWRVDFQDQDEDGKVLEYQLLFRVLLGEINGKQQIFGMGFL